MSTGVSCAKHGVRREAFVCHHMNKEYPVGFHTPDEKTLNAWCDECDEILNEEGSWTERAWKFANVMLCCEDCFNEIKGLNNKSKAN